MHWEAYVGRNEVSANLSRRLRTVVDRPQTGLMIGPSAVGQRPRTIHEQPSPGPFGVNLGTAGVSPERAHPILDRHDAVTSAPADVCSRLETGLEALIPH